MREILGEVQRWREQGKRVALATVVKVYGSAPRPLGAKMAVSSEGEMAGSVSGGCVEGAVAQEALEVLQQGAPRLVEYGIGDDFARTVGLACGGNIEVFIEPLP
jgi:xanthine dehydrogenase accessory factor